MPMSSSRFQKGGQRARGQEAVGSALPHAGGDADSVDPIPISANAPLYNTFCNLLCYPTKKEYYSNLPPHTVSNINIMS